MTMESETFEELAIKVWSQVGDLAADAIGPGAIGQERTIAVDFGGAWPKTLKGGFKATRNGQEWERSLLGMFRMQRLRGSACRRIRIVHTEDGKAFGSLLAIGVLDPHAGHPADEGGEAPVHRFRVDAIGWTDGIREWSRREARRKGAGGPLPAIPAKCGVMLAAKECVARSRIFSEIGRLESMIPKGKAMDLLIAEIEAAVGLGGSPARMAA